MRVAPTLLYNNGEMKKNNKAELINEISTILIDALMESDFHGIEECALLYRIYCAKVGNVKNLYTSFKQTPLTECEINTNQISIFFNGYTG